MSALCKLNDCCTVDNVELQTGNGDIACKVNCLVCRTCQSQFTFMYDESDEMNACFSYVKHAVERSIAGVPVFQNPKQWI